MLLSTPSALPSQGHPSDSHLIACIERSGITALFTVPCTITAGWHHELLRRSADGPLCLQPTTHEGNLAGLAAGSWLATGRPALIHLQNCGLPNLADGILTFAQPRLCAIPMAVIVTFRGATASDTSEPHQEVGEHTDALVATIFGLGALSPHAFAASSCASTPTGPAPPGDPVALVERLSRRQQQGWSPPGSGGAEWSREEAISAIRAGHPGVAVLFSNGYTARAAQATGDRASDFFNVGYMGGTLAIGWALAKGRPDLDVLQVPLEEPLRQVPGLAEG